MAETTTQRHDLTPRPVRDSEITLAQMMLPTDANPHGNVHGGVIMKLVDTAGGLAATRHARSRVVTVTVDTMTFHEPVYVGNLLRLYACLTWTGRTSMEAQVRVEAEDVIAGTVTHTSTAYLVFVALDEANQPRPVPPLELLTDEERARWEQAQRRHQRRMAERVG